MRPLVVTCRRQSNHHDTRVDASGEVISQAMVEVETATASSVATRADQVAVRHRADHQYPTHSTIPTATNGATSTA